MIMECKQDYIQQMMQKIFNKPFWYEEYSVDNVNFITIRHDSYNEMISYMMTVNGWGKKEAVDVAKKEAVKRYPRFTEAVQFRLYKWVSQYDPCTLSLNAKDGTCTITTSKYGSYTSDTISEPLARITLQLLDAMSTTEKQYLKFLLLDGN